MELVLGEVTDPSGLNDPSTPQGMAFDWIVATDPAQVDPCSEIDAVQQRYAVVTFYYSTNGMDWVDSTGWLSGESECTWFGVICASSQVDTMSLGTFFKERK